MQKIASKSSSNSLDDIFESFSDFIFIVDSMLSVPESSCDSKTDCDFDSSLAFDDSFSPCSKLW